MTIVDLIKKSIFIFWGTILEKVIGSSCEKDAEKRRKCQEALEQEGIVQTTEQPEWRKNL